MLCRGRLCKEAACPMLARILSAMIVLFGARFTQVYAERHGTPIAAGKNMMRK